MKELLDYIDETDPKLLTDTFTFLKKVKTLLPTKNPITIQKLLKERDRLQTRTDLLYLTNLEEGLLETYIQLEMEKEV